MSTSISISADYGYILLTAVGFYICQNFIVVMPVIIWRSKTGIKAVRHNLNAT